MGYKQNKKRELEGLCENILLIHAFFSCDTTSTLYGIWKPVALSLFRSSNKFRESDAVFCKHGASKEDIRATGEQAILCVYKAKSNETLTSLRCRLFHGKVLSSSSFVKPETLPPTPAAAQYHYFRVYLQVMEWKCVTKLLPEDWGWFCHNGKYVPVVTDKPAPTDLLKIIHCSCATVCTTMKCSCKQNGLICTTSCGVCMGRKCENCAETQDDSDEDIDME